MADSIPSLRRKLDEALAEIESLRRQLADVPEPVVKTVYVDREVRVPGPEKIVYVDREVASPPVVRTEYIYVDREVPGPCRTEYVYVDRGVTEYVDNPEHLRMIAELQGRLQAWQAISQSDS